MNDLHIVTCELRKNHGFTALAVLMLVLINECNGTTTSRRHLVDSTL